MAVLGTIELSADILDKTNIGLWAFELDPGASPRMYVNDTMLHLIGLDKQTTPELTYRAWYDHVDPDHYDQVHASMDQMITGVHAEVQYPWHHPDGHVMIVRCGGVRNYLYTKGIRIEGTHMNVSEITHVEKQSLADLIVRLADNYLNVYFLDPYSGKFEIYAGNSLDGSEAPTFGNFQNFYTYIAERNKDFICPDDQAAFNEMFTQSNLIHLLENDNPAEFTARWKKSDNDYYRYMKSKISVYEEADGTKKLIIGIQDVTKEKLNELQLEEKFELVEALTQDYDYVDIVELHEDKHEDTCSHFRIPNRNDNYVPGWNANIPYTEKLDQLRDYMVLDADRDNFYKQTRREVILDRLKRNNVYYINFRIITYGIIHYAQMKFTGIKDASGKIVRFLVAYINADKQVLVQKDLHDRLTVAGKQIEQLKSEKADLRNTLEQNVYKPLKELLDLDRKAITDINNTRLIRETLNEINISSKRILRVINDQVLDAISDASDKPLDLSMLKGKYFLLAEDNILNCEIAKDIFEEYGVTIEVSENGQLIVNKCKEIFESNTARRPDMILMDCQMPVMDGYEATRQICEMMDEYDERIPIIAMTANAFEEEKKRCLECGMRDHIAKPVDRKELEHVLLKYLH